VKAIATGNELAANLVRLVVMAESYCGLSRIQLVDSHVRDFKEQRPARRRARRNEILHDFILTVDGDAASGQRCKIDAVAFPIDVEENAVVEHAFALESVADAAFDHQIDRALLENSGPNALTWSFGRSSMMTESIPAMCSRCPSIKPAGPAPTIPT
jgi:hypothetical protein